MDHQIALNAQIISIFTLLSAFPTVHFFYFNNLKNIIFFYLFITIFEGSAYTSKCK